MDRLICWCVAGTLIDSGDSHEWYFDRLNELRKFFERYDDEIYNVQVWEVRIEYGTHRCLWNKLNQLP